MVRTIELALQTKGNTDILDITDLKRTLDEIAPADRDYQHYLKWGDGNGLAHLRAALVGPAVTVPVVDSQLILGTWQQIIFLDSDNRPRRRTLVVQLVGEYEHYHSL